MTYKNLLKKGIDIALEHGKEEEAVKFLFLELSNMSASDFYLNYELEISNNEFADKFLNAVKEYVINDVPVQHIIKYSYFYGYKYIVNEDVLIPRRETEELVENIILYYDKYFENEVVDVLDLCTGSGCIGITLSLEEEKLLLTATDISEEAIIIANKNKEKLGAKIDIFVSDLFEKIDKTFDIIVSNPPYIPDNEIVDEIVKKEPGVALYGGVDGTSFYEKIINKLSKHIKKRALVGFEHGYQQKDKIREIIYKYFPESIIIQKKDLQDKDRFTFFGIGGVLEYE